MIILRNKSHGEIIRVCMRIFTTALRDKKYGQILNKNTSPYFYSASERLVWMRPCHLFPRCEDVRGIGHLVVFLFR